MGGGGSTANASSASTQATAEEVARQEGKEAKKALAPEIAQSLAAEFLLSEADVFRAWIRFGELDDLEESFVSSDSLKAHPKLASILEQHPFLPGILHEAARIFPRCTAESGGTVVGHILVAGVTQRIEFCIL